MEYILIGIISLLGSGLTLFSGFGLGTILLPIFAIFFPIELAIALTAIVHFLNNLFKLFLLGKYANWKVVLMFGIPAIIAAWLGAELMTTINDLPAIYSYTINNHVYNIEPINLSIAVLLIFFALFDVIPALSKWQVSPKYLPVGGLLSGFVGGFSGHQGVLRSAFLIRLNLAKEAFIATGVVIACMIDVTRLSVYAQALRHEQLDYSLIGVASLSAFVGAYFGSKLLHKVTIESVQRLVAIALIIFAFFFGSGII